MEIQTAIERALEGGWNAEECAPPIGSRDKFNIERMLIDPSFWQALGKSLGWKRVCKRCGDESMAKSLGACDLCEGQGRDRALLFRFQDAWLFHWHELIDHLAEGKSIKDFFKDINPQ